MFCQFCGNTLGDGSSKCDSCGKEVVTAQTRKMGKGQSAGSFRRILVFVYIVLLLVVLLYPPHYVVHEGTKISRERYFLFNSPSPLLHPDGAKLGIHALILTVIFGAGYYGMKMKAAR